jgi:hypothetical protein
MERHMTKFTKKAAIAKLRKLAPDLPSPTFADALSMLCHCGKKLNEHCRCNARELGSIDKTDEKAAARDRALSEQVDGPRIERGLMATGLH